MPVVLALFLVALSPMPAHAYLDPGTGSMIIHLFIGAVASGLVGIGFYWAKIKKFFSKPVATDDGHNHDHD